MSELAVPAVDEKAGLETTRSSRTRLIAGIALGLMLLVGGLGTAGYFAYNRIADLKSERGRLERDNGALAATKRHDERALKTTRSTLAETSAQLAVSKAKLAKAQRAVQDAQTSAAGQFSQGYDAGAGDSYNSGWNGGYESGYREGYYRGYYDAGG